MIDNICKLSMFVVIGNGNNLCCRRTTVFTFRELQGSMEDFQSGEEVIKFLVFLLCCKLLFYGHEQISIGVNCPTPTGPCKNSRSAVLTVTLSIMITLFLPYMYNSISA